jgi:hypothetical protein
MLCHMPYKKTGFFKGAFNKMPFKNNLTEIKEFIQIEITGHNSFIKSIKFTYKDSEDKIVEQSIGVDEGNKPYHQREKLYFNDGEYITETIVKGIANVQYIKITKNTGEILEIGETHTDQDIHLNGFYGIFGATYTLDTGSIAISSLGFFVPEDEK